MRRFRTIDNSNNKRIKELVKIRDGKIPGDLWFIEGLNIIREAKISGTGIKELFVTKKCIDRYHEEIRTFRLPDNDITVITERISHKIADTKHPQGIFALTEFRLEELDSLYPSSKEIIPVIDRIQEPGNLGTILRTINAFGLNDVILIEGTCSPSNQKVIRASAGGLFHLGIAWTSPDEFVTWAKRNKLKIFSADAKGKKTIHDIAPVERACVVLGNEPSGVSDYLKNRADAVVKIPMPGKAESLNVAITSAIVLYELTRRSGPSQKGTR